MPPAPNIDWISYGPSFVPAFSPIVRRIINRAVTRGNGDYCLGGRELLRTTTTNCTGRSQKKAGENVSGSLDSFSTFVQKKTAEIRKQYGCQEAEFSVELNGGQVKLKAKAKS
jgi:hypothetical protein